MEREGGVDVNGGMRRALLRDLTLLLPLLVLLGSLMGTYAARGSRFTVPLAAAARPPHISPTPSPHRPPSPTPTRVPTPAPPADLSASRSCSARAPQPYASIVDAASPQSAGGQVPTEVALTFDDGPSESTTPLFLDYLEQTHTPATFFVIGNQAQQVPDLIQREWRDGFTIGVHTWDHPDMTTLSVGQMQEQFSSTLQTLHDTLGSAACIWLWRPPYGAVNSTVHNVAASYGLTTVTWDVDSLDWTQPGVDAIVNNILNEVHPGSIILMHDGPAQRDQTLAALPYILYGLSARHLIPVSLPQLLADCGYPTA
jgi:peptidoglycan/xylan/chitin deacetylase (PgdA/CDA1 family)